MLNNLRIHWIVLVKFFAMRTFTLNWFHLYKCAGLQFIVDFVWHTRRIGCLLLRQYLYIDWFCVYLYTSIKIFFSNFVEWVYNKFHKNWCSVNLMELQKKPGHVALLRLLGTSSRTRLSWCRGQKLIHFPYIENLY